MTQRSKLQHHDENSAHLCKSLYHWPITIATFKLTLKKKAFIYPTTITWCGYMPSVVYCIVYFLALNLRSENYAWKHSQSSHFLFIEYNYSLTAVQKVKLFLIEPFVSILCIYTFVYAKKKRWASNPKKQYACAQLWCIQYKL